MAAALNQISVLQAQVVVVTAGQSQQLELKDILESDLLSNNEYDGEYLEPGLKNFSEITRI